MKNPTLLVIVLSVLFISGCGSEAGDSANLANANNAPAQKPPNPNWPEPDWMTNSEAALANAKQLTFSAPGLKSGTISVPDDWTELGNKPSSMLLKSPTVNEKFANLVLWASNTKPVLGGMPRPNRDFDYSAFEPQQALDHFQEMRGKDPEGGHTQRLTVGGLHGLLEQAIFRENSNANATQKETEAAWKWTTFIKSKQGIQQIFLAVVYPSGDKELYKERISAIVNSVKFEPDSETIVISPKPVLSQ